MTRYRLDSQFHCPYIESREVLEKTRQKPGEKKAREIISLSFSVPVTSFPVTSSPVMQLPVMQLLVTSFPVTSLLHVPAPPQIINEWCIYTTKF